MRNVNKRVWARMWSNLFMRIIRRKLVLGFILTVSTIYCIASFWQDTSRERNSVGDTGETNHPRSLFLWRGDDDEVNENDTNIKAVTCRNSIQGKELIVDEKGYICARKDILVSGCCNLEGSLTRRFACDTCQPTGCCSIYEYCISCCLHPDKKTLLQDVLGAASENVLFASVTDHFELCLAKCRTSSQSVRHENSYRDPQAKHCYGPTPLGDS